MDELKSNEKTTAARFAKTITIPTTTREGPRSLSDQPLAE